MPAGQLEFKLTPEWERFTKESPWAVFIQELAEDDKGQRFMRKRGSSVIYKLNKDNTKSVCNTCGSEIQGATVVHPIWDGPSPCSGSGRVHKETVPYCPKCEKKPNYSGSPIMD